MNGFCPSCGNVLPTHRATCNVGQHGAPAGGSEAAFENALAEGRLSHDRDAPNYVGDYMWMGWNDSTRRDAFKHRNTRKYLP